MDIKITIVMAKEVSYKKRGFCISMDWEVKKRLSGEHMLCIETIVGQV